MQQNLIAGESVLVNREVSESEKKRENVSTVVTQWATTITQTIAVVVKNEATLESLWRLSRAPLRTMSRFASLHIVWTPSA